MPDVNLVFNLTGRTTYRIRLRRSHLTAPLAKLLAKLEDATSKREEADRAVRTCGHGTGPERAGYEQAAKQAQAAQAEALDALLGASVKQKRQLSGHIVDRYNTALDQAARAEAAYLAALDEAADAAALYAVVESPLTVLDVDERTVARQHPARFAAVNTAAMLRAVNLPALDA